MLKGFCYTKLRVFLSNCNYIVDLLSDYLAKISSCSDSIRLICKVYNWNASVLICYGATSLFLGFVNVNEIGMQITNNSIKRGHSFKLYKQFCNRSVRSHIFTKRVVNVRYDMPSEEVTFVSIHALKESVANTDLNQFPVFSLQFKRTGFSRFVYFFTFHCVHCVVLKLYLIFNLRYYFFVFVSIPLATVRGCVTLLPSYTVNLYC